ncbi:MAG: hypothetical protein IPI54_07875 [Chitinophagaceae bacterium]|nr:hypothetical protein [Chitinophagaceae bacterium]
MAKILFVLFVAGGLQMSATAQENSPYSRYGIGDLTPNHNVFTRGMGGIAAGITDTRSVNFTNPASLTSIYNTIFDVGTEIDYRILKSSNPAKKFTSANTYVSYLTMAFPLTTPKMAKKNMFWAMSFGIKPVSKMNYKIEKNERLTGIDSLNTLYEGSGGLNQAFFGTGFKYKNLSVGINAGYMFGNKDYNTLLTFISDSSFFYYLSNSSNKTTFGGLFINGGMQYDIALARDEKNPDFITKKIKLGVYGNLQQNLKARTDIVRETIFYDQNGGYYRLDSVYEEKDVKGTIKLPAMIGFGATYQDANWLFGADFEYGNWASYRYYGQADAVQNNWTIRAGAQYYPAKDNTPVKKYFNFVKYRAGFYYGSDYIKVNQNRPEYGFTIGTGMPLTSLKRISYTGEYVVLNTALEFGNRGNRQTNLRESVVRFSIGVSMNARWFQKPKYN